MRLQFLLHLTSNETSNFIAFQMRQILLHLASNETAIWANLGTLFIGQFAFKSAQRIISMCQRPR